MSENSKKTATIFIKDDGDSIVLGLVDTGAAGIVGVKLSHLETEHVIAGLSQVLALAKQRQAEEAAER